jgi:hypothetical protein
MEEHTALTNAHDMVNEVHEAVVVHRQGQEYAAVVTAVWTQAATCVRPV